LLDCTIRLQTVGIRVNFFERVATTKSSDRLCVTPQDVEAACRQQKKGKSAGPDGLHMEAFVLGCNRLFVHLSVVLNLFLAHGHIPSEFMQTVIVPLVKSKTGNMNDVNNYRAIALSNAVSKILECILLILRLILMLTFTSSDLRLVTALVSAQICSRILSGITRTMAVMFLCVFWISKKHSIKSIIGICSINS